MAGSKVYTRTTGNAVWITIAWRSPRACRSTWSTACGGPTGNTAGFGTWGQRQFDKDGQFLGYIGSCVEIPAPARATAVGPLTVREVQVLTLVAEGHSTKKIAALLGISYKTADSHRSRIMEKLGVHETASLVRYAIRQGIVRA